MEGNLLYIVNRMDCPHGGAIINRRNYDLLKDIYSPIFIWIIAFFGDYLYTLSSLNKETQILDSRWTLVSYIAIICIFINFLIGIYWECDLGRCVSMVGLFICMLGLKAASLYVLCPRQRVITV